MGMRCAEGTAAMDLRFEAFNLIDRDPVLRSLLVTCATCLVYAGASDAGRPGLLPRARLDRGRH